MIGLLLSLALAAPAAGAVLPLPYSLRLTGQAAFDKNEGVGACLRVALAELRVQRLILEQKCSHQDRGELAWGPVSQTLVEGVHCAVTQQVVCKAPARPARAESEPELPAVVERPPSPN